MENLVINRERGFYSFTHKEKAYTLPSVTAVLNRFFPAHYSEEARRRGTYIHAATALLDGAGDGSGLSWPHVPMELRGYLEGWERFKKDMETATKSETWLVDLKTGGREPWHALQTAAYLKTLRTMILITPGWRIERPAFSLRYRFAGTPDRVWHDGGKRRRLSVYLSETGGYTTQEWTDPGDLAAFLGLLAASNWMINHGVTF